MGDALRHIVPPRYVTLPRHVARCKQVNTKHIKVLTNWHASCMLNDARRNIETEILPLTLRATMIRKNAPFPGNTVDCWRTKRGKLTKRAARYLAQRTADHYAMLAKLYPTTKG